MFKRAASTFVELAIWLVLFAMLVSGYTLPPGKTTNPAPATPKFPHWR